MNDSTIRNGPAMPSCNHLHMHRMAKERQNRMSSLTYDTRPTLPEISIRHLVSKNIPHDLPHDQEKKITTIQPRSKLQTYLKRKLNAQGNYEQNCDQNGPNRIVPPTTNQPRVSTYGSRRTEYRAIALPCRIPILDLGASPEIGVHGVYDEEECNGHEDKSIYLCIACKKLSGNGRKGRDEM